MIDLLHPYQKTGAKWLSQHPQALLADEMGVGKSAQVIRACDILNLDRILVVGPAIGKWNWLDEFEKFQIFPRKLSVVNTGKDKIPSEGVVSMSYDMAVVHQKAIKATAWDAVVMDEAHFCKERTAKRTKAFYGHGKANPGIAASARYTWRLTGTPAPNTPDELWTHLKSMGVTDLPYWDFAFRFCEGFDGGYGWKPTGAKNVGELKELLAKCMLRRKKEDVMADLPPLTISSVAVPAAPVELDNTEFFMELQKFGADGFPEYIRRIDMLVKAGLWVADKSYHAAGEQAVNFLQSQAQGLSPYRRYVVASKVPAVAEILKEELKADHRKKIVIFGHHRAGIELMVEALKDFGAAVIYGGTSDRNKFGRLKRFKEEPHARVLILSITACSTSINLTEANEVVFMEQDWVPGNNAQALMRVHRMGQKKPVTCRIFYIENSVDKDVQKALERKTKELTKFL